MIHISIQPAAPPHKKEGKNLLSLFIAPSHLIASFLLEHTHGHLCSPDCHQMVECKSRFSHSHTVRSLCAQISDFLFALSLIIVSRCQAGSTTVGGLYVVVLRILGNISSIIVHLRTIHPCLKSETRWTDGSPYPRQHQKTRSRKRE